MRDANHFRKMFDDNPGAGIGFSLAASAVYAQRYGVCEARAGNRPPAGNPGEQKG